MPDTRMSRARLYVLIDAFEQDMRELVQRYVLSHMTEEEALGPDYQGASLLRSNETGYDHVSIVHYLHLRQCYDILNRNRADLPSEVAEEMRSNTAQMDNLVPLRNRVMHGRPLRVDDPESAISALQGFRSRHWSETRACWLGW